MALIIEDEYAFDGTAQELWRLIFNPESMREIIPGCRKLELLEDGSYRGEIMVGIAAVSGTYLTRVCVAEETPPTFARLTGEVSGPTGTITGKASFDLKEGNGETTFHYTGEAIISGALGRMNPRFIQGVATTLIKQGLGRLEKQRSDERPGTPG